MEPFFDHIQACLELTYEYIFLMGMSIFYLKKYLKISATKRCGGTKKAPGDVLSA